MAGSIPGQNGGIGFLETGHLASDELRLDMGYAAQKYFSAVDTAADGATCTSLYNLSADGRH